jgi:hypothetical protein
MNKNLKALESELDKNECIAFQTNTNAPFFSILNVLEKREKAIKVAHENKPNMPVWLPKSAIIECDTPGAFSLNPKQ